MEYYYTITPEQADLITQFTYAENKQVNPYVGKQINGDFLVSKKVYEILKDTPKFKKIDWSTVPLVPENELNPKPSPFPPK